MRRVVRRGRVLVASIGCDDDDVSLYIISYTRSKSTAVTTRRLLINISGLRLEGWTAAPADARASGTYIYIGFSTR